MHKRNLLFVVFISFVSSFCYSQAGAHIFAGGVIATSKDANLTIPKSGSKGYEIGLDARLNSDDMYFLFGAKYVVLTQEKMSIIKGRLGLGFDIIHFSRNIYLRTKLQGSINFINDFDASIPTAPGYETVNDGFAGVASGLGLTIGPFMVDIDYEYGLFNVAYKQKESKLNFIGLNAGFRF